MGDGRLSRVLQRFQDLPILSLPTDHPRPVGGNKLIEAAHIAQLSSQTALSLLKLVLYTENETEDDEDSDPSLHAPSAFHLLLAAFVALLHRYTADTDMIIASSSASASDPLLLRLSVDPTDPYWAVVRRLQQVERQAEADALPFDTITRALNKDHSEPSRPLFRVRFFDETDEPKDNFIHSTSLTSDLTVFVMRPPASTRSSIAPRISLRILYNSLLFTSARIACIVDQLSVLLRKVASNPLAQVGSIPLLTPSQRERLPDPTANLNWCGWKGAITDVFSRNAREWPDRPCIIQSIPASSLSLQQERITYSYSTIRRASNILAHHLLRGGIKREEVVTVYAYRSVELVVAVMAVLKAGAIFSVIDPAYPPARQMIYLKVARPRGLIVLKGAGKISPSVRDFISDELCVRIEVPALQLTPDGSLSGGSSRTLNLGLDDSDVLEAHHNLADTDPNVILGPDSPGTLSFTSGSTDVPKGVKGRHYSLTHFFPWMGERFGLDTESKFTMLSGIAHDPIQRDIFTPLFFGAQLHVPTADDIGTPGRLAEWMASSGVTVTHLTPAMGQLLSAQAMHQIPTLLNAFFVGDILTKRDCLRLQALAANVRIVNMYGTTETQRAVSYFAIPPISCDPTFLATQKEIILAGEGMKDVQLLVVNRHDRKVPCAVGEVGEIYVRSGGLAEGYLDQDATAAKFVTNWFAAPSGTASRDIILHPEHGLPGPEARHWKGVRDRMYRSGDLGRYLPDGLVECTGRADDQVKIRGFRIELGEIDTHLAQHPLVRENVTLVRRDKDEEKILVSYFVPVEGPGLDAFASDIGTDGGEDAANKGVAKGTSRYRRLIKDIREHLKKKLPSYSVPSLFVPLKRMPLNPNGKIDKPALPFPDTAHATSAARVNGAPVAGAKGTPTEEHMRVIWSHVLADSIPAHAIPLDENFFDLGGHSILATRLIFEIRKAFVVEDAPLGWIFERPTIRELAAAVDELRNADMGLTFKENGDPLMTSAVLPGAPGEALQAKPPAAPALEYGADCEILLSELRETYAAVPADFASRPLTVFLTGATGFLGAFVLRELLRHEGKVGKVVCLIRGSDSHRALNRLKESSKDRGVWDDTWVTSQRLEVVVGDLTKEKFGLEMDVYDRVAAEADVVLHNGALVHWVYPYAKLRAANVLSTLTSIELASTKKQKLFVFVSSTSAIDTEHYVQLSDSLVSNVGGEYRGVPESEDLEGARFKLKTGYGQTKWVSEKLLFEAARRGLRGHIVRPGYVVGDSRDAVTNTDDFIWRLVKGCVQLGLVPDINNTINMVPVDHVALCTALAAIAPLPDPQLTVLHIAASPALKFNDVFDSLMAYGYAARRCEYLVWRRKLEQHAMDAQDNALFPLLHFVLDDLPRSTKAPELDDRNTRALLRSHLDDACVSMTVTEEIMGRYLAWLVGAKFLSPPTVAEPEKALPEIRSLGVTIKAAGRTGM